jgi:hypothetical protein
MDPRLNKTTKSFFNRNILLNKENRSKSPELIAHLNQKFNKLQNFKDYQESVYITRDSLPSTPKGSEKSKKSSNITRLFP